jgi:signal transduction histidine kinase
MSTESGVRAVTDRRLRQALRALARRPYADVAIAAALYVSTLLTTAAGTASGRGLDGLAIALATVACGALVLRRRFPFPVLLLSAVAAEGFLALYQGRQGMLVLAAPLVALYTVAEVSDRRRALVIGGAAVLVLAGLHAAMRPSGWQGADNLALAALGALAVAAGDATRSRRAYLAEVEERARRAERERHQQARQALIDERLRIARDLHDSVGHHLALINVQAGVATYVLDSQPAQAQQAQQALRHIRQASRSGLDELRDTIALLRTPDEAVAPTEPTLGLSSLDDLVATFRRSGLRIGRETTGTARPLPATADLTAYRVVQESLTNACKHVTDATVVLRLDYQPAALRIVVHSAGLPAPAGAARGSGHGIVGMRERVAALGGSLAAGTQPDGGFRITATLPLAHGGPA